ncbi:MAG TPA: carboxypeptidase-like regulatory domain-containing protein [Candidatus Tidjanibacter faecipullorum]|uniref:Carboxypeptidase-like regulatory domain-containing protein n=1 Tax=Candidatus Tidjanibacter faecipullorum TaxID=2838766 RepID=A0A9D2DCK8_9BACT|nr:carboxypeptidase-like regulatory domain-containing protein [Candidatus Tidjanibacter faecipullorum]
MKPFTSLSKWYIGLLVLVGSLWSVPALGAEPYVEGVVRDTLGAGIPYATVSLLPESAETGAVEDGAVVFGSITDESGRYRIDGVAAGHYRLVCDHLSFVSQQCSVAVRSGRNEHDFRLVPAAEAIEAVEVVGTTMRTEAGKYSISLAESSITENKTVEETLQMLPGLSVVNDQVRLDGRPVALVYIDDREVIDMRELKALKGEYIESVEVQNQTGSAYSATKQGGIVRIKLKKRQSGAILVMLH